MNSVAVHKSSQASAGVPALRNLVELPVPEADLAGSALALGEPRARAVAKNGSG